MGRAFIGASLGRLFMVLLLAFLTSLGFGPDWWVSSITSWFADPIGLTLLAARALFVVLAGGCLIVLLWRPLLAALRPAKFIVSFNKERDVHANLTQVNSVTGQPIKNKITYVHVHVRASSTGQIANCTGWITKLEKLDGDKKPIQTLEETRQLVWAPREAGIINQVIPADTSHTLDVFRTIEDVNRLEVLAIAAPFSWGSFFDQHGLYRITVSVSGENQTKAIRLSVNWRGSWTDFDIEAS